MSLGRPGICSTVVKAHLGYVTKTSSAIMAICFHVLQTPPSNIISKHHFFLLLREAAMAGWKIRDARWRRGGWLSDVLSIDFPPPFAIRRADGWQRKKGRRRGNFPLIRREREREILQVSRSRLSCKRAIYQGERHNSVGLRRLTAQKDRMVVKNSWASLPFYLLPLFAVLAILYTPCQHLVGFPQSWRKAKEMGGKEGRKATTTTQDDPYYSHSLFWGFKSWHTQCGSSFLSWYYFGVLRIL